MNNTSNSTSSFNDAFQTLTPSTVMIIIVVFLILIIYLTYIVRMWFVQSATFKMQEDLEAIKRYLMAESTNAIRPADNQNIQLKTIKPKQEFKKPRPIFMWLSIAIPVLLVGLVVLLNAY